MSLAIKSHRHEHSFFPLLASRLKYDPAPFENIMEHIQKRLKLKREPKKEPKDIKKPLVPKEKKAPREGKSGKPVKKMKTKSNFFGCFFMYLIPLL